MLQSNGAPPLPPFFVGKQIVQDRINRFIKQKYPILCNAIGKPDTRSIWYSKDHVAQWLSEITKAEADGMRVYFGSQDETEDYPGQTCLLMVLTRPDPTGTGHVDILLEDEPDFSSRSVQFDKLERGKKNFNTGSPCPPICDTGIKY